MFKRFLNKPNKILSFFFLIFFLSFGIYIFASGTKQIHERRGRERMVTEINQLKKLGEKKRELVASLINQNIYEDMITSHMIAVTEVTTPEYDPDRVLEQMIVANRTRQFNDNMFLKLLPYKDDQKAFETLVDIMTLDNKIYAQQKIVESTLLY